MKVNGLLRPTEPWLYILGGEASAVTRCSEALRAEALTAYVLDALVVQDVDGLFAEFGAQLEFPEYFGRNWPAFAECVADLDWLPAGYVLFVENASSLLVREPPEELEVLLRILSGAAQEWAEPVEVGESWDRPARPFHVVFHDTADRIQQLSERLGSTGVETGLLLA